MLFGGCFFRRRNTFKILSKKGLENHSVNKPRLVKLLVNHKANQQIIKSHSQPFAKTYLTFFQNLSFTLYSLQLEDTIDKCAIEIENIAIAIINKITRSTNIVVLGETVTSNNELFEIQLNLLFSSANSSDHLERQYLQNFKISGYFP